MMDVDTTIRTGFRREHECVMPGLAAAAAASTCAAAAARRRRRDGSGRRRSLIDLHGPTPRGAGGGERRGEEEENACAFYSAVHWEDDFSGGWD